MEGAYEGAEILTAKAKDCAQGMSKPILTTDLPFPSRLTDIYRQI